MATARPLINTAVLSNIAPSYAPPGTALIASTVVGATEDSLARHLRLGPRRATPMPHRQLAFVEQERRQLI
jgi:hypothetical protein